MRWASSWTRRLPAWPYGLVWFRFLDQLRPHLVCDLVCYFSEDNKIKIHGMYFQIRNPITCVALQH